MFCGSTLAPNVSLNYHDSAAQQHEAFDVIQETLRLLKSEGRSVIDSVATQFMR
jgi:hypothetical protein